MGRQLGFLMLNTDEQWFLNNVLSGSYIKVLQRSGNDFNSMIVMNPAQEIPDNNLGQVFFWNTNFDLYETDLHSSTSQNKQKRDYKVYSWSNGALTLNPDPFPLSLRKNPEKARLFIHPSEAPVIEYCRSFLVQKDNMLRKGRIWMEKNRVGDEQWEYKGEEFEKWYDSIVRWVRKNFVRVPEHDAYFGPDALDWYKAGGKIFNPTSVKMNRE